jgi:dual oxidase
MTSWIDGSFVYSTSEAWVNSMRSFHNGTFRCGEEDEDVAAGEVPGKRWMLEGEDAETMARTQMPPRNKGRVPLFNAPVPHVLRNLSPERLFRECIQRYTCISTGIH